MIARTQPRYEALCKVKIDTLQKAKNQCEAVRGAVASLRHLLKSERALYDENERLNERVREVEKLLGVAAEGEALKLIAEIFQIGRRQQEIQKRAKPVAERGQYLCRQIRSGLAALVESDFAVMATELVSECEPDIFQETQS